MKKKPRTDEQDERKPVTPAVRQDRDYTPGLWRRTPRGTLGR